eukprot:Pgem_evm1s2309
MDETMAKTLQAQTERIQNQAARIALNLPRRASRKLFKANLQPITDRALNLLVLDRYALQAIINNPAIREATTHYLKTPNTYEGKQ